MRDFYIDHGWPNSRKCKHVVRYFDGENTYQNGSPLYHPKCFSRKPDRDAFISNLLASGYQWKQWEAK